MAVEGIDIMVPTHGRLDLTMRCMDAIYGNTSTPFHLIIIDDSDPNSEDPLTSLTPLYFEKLRKLRDNITFVHSEVPFTCGNQIINTGLKHCKHEFAANVMNSIRVQRDWEVVAVQILTNNPKIGMVGFKCLFPWGRIESAGIGMSDFSPVDIGRDLPGHDLNCIVETQAAQWAFGLLRREAVVDVLPEDVFNGFVGWDDIDNCFVLRDKGWKIFYCGLGVGYHTPRATRGNNSQEVYIKNRENAELFYNRWGLWDKFLQSGRKTVEQLKKELKETGTVQIPPREN